MHIIRNHIVKNLYTIIIMKKELLLLSIAAIFALASCSQKKALPKSAYEPAETTVSVAVDPQRTVTVQTNEVRQDESVSSRSENVRLQGEGVLKKYSIIVGSFQNSTNAKNLQTRLISQGYNSTILMNTERQMYRVSINSFDYEADARNEARRIKSIFPDFSDAWILIAR